MRQLFFILLASIPLVSLAQPSDNEKIELAAPSIKTIQFYRQGWDMSYPIIRLNADEKLELHFDDLDANVKSYRYEIIHCSSNWQPSPISYSEYMDGFPENMLRNYSYSINTTVPYIHYSLVIPNDEVKLKLSGNYVISVYLDDSSEPVLVRRFSVFESLVNIQAECIRPLNPAYMYTKQQLNCKLQTNLSLPNMATDVKLVVRQNGNPYSSKVEPKAISTGPNELDFSFQDGLLFDAGNEFRNLDIKSIRYTAINIESIAYQAPNYHVYVMPEDQNARKRYSYQEDLNGQFIIRNDRGITSNTDADYVFVHFALPYFEEAEGDVYLFGALTNWQLTDSFKMRYNFRNQRYEHTALLKQGYYNYQYVFVPKGKPLTSSTTAMFENSFYETENEYFLFAYINKPNERFQRLGGYAIVNSVKKGK